MIQCPPPVRENNGALYPQSDDFRWTGALRSTAVEFYKIDEWSKMVAFKSIGLHREHVRDIGATRKILG